ncbi:arsenic resistance protein [Microbacterium tumbae]
MLYTIAVLAGATGGMLAPAAAGPLATAVTPVLGLLLFATFLGVPFDRFASALRDGRFLAAVLSVNFVLVPLIVFMLSRLVVGDDALLLGVLLVLLAPCVDYVIVFAGLAGGAKERLLASTPILMALQIVLLPVFLWLIVGPDAALAFDARPFLEAFLLLIVAPLALAVIMQLLAARHRVARGVRTVATMSMVPLMMLTLAVVIASQVFMVSGSLPSLWAVVPVFVAFVALLAPLGALIGRAFRLDEPGQRAVLFSGATRNSLVVLPLALALPPSFALTPLVVVTQTLVELVAMVVLVAVVPRIGPGQRRRRGTDGR